MRGPSRAGCKASPTRLGRGAGASPGLDFLVRQRSAESAANLVAQGRSLYCFDPLGSTHPSHEAPSVEVSGKSFFQCDPAIGRRGARLANTIILRTPK